MSVGPVAGQILALWPWESDLPLSMLLSPNL